jgi:hypothetical protein
MQTHTGRNIYNNINKTTRQEKNNGGAGYRSSNTRNTNKETNGEKNQNFFIFSYFIFIFLFFIRNLAARPFAWLKM